MSLTSKQIAIGSAILVLIIIIIVVSMSYASAPVITPAPSPTYTQPSPSPVPVPSPLPVTTQTPSFVPGWQGASVADINMRLGGNSETPATCRQLARDGAYVAWGYRNSTHPDPAFRNTCFAYRKIVPFSGTPSNTIDITGCVADGKMPSTGCV